MKDEKLMMEQLQRYYTLWRESNVVYEEWARAHGLSFNSVLILYSFYEDNMACTQKLISQKWVIPKQTVNTALKEFEKQGYIELVPTPEDKRNKQIHLTPVGRQYTEKIISELRSLELYVMKEMGLSRMMGMNEDMALFIELFRKGGEKENEPT